jgi:hypothetical protein
MKKWVLIVGLIAVGGAIYIFFSREHKISKVIKGKCSILAANRCFTDTSKWAKWWPQGGPGYEITGVYYNEVRVRLRNAGDTGIAGVMRIAQINMDSVAVGWESAVVRHKKEVGEKIDVILNAFKSYVEKPENIYGVNFKQTFCNDSTLITLNLISTNYPTTALIYRMIDSLKDYAASQHAKEINFPMLNVSQISNTEYKVMVALSLDKRLAGTGRIVIKRFVPWKMLEGEVYGGTSLVIRALRQLYLFRDDHRLSIMAVPFQSLITDRSKEQDSTKWVTKVCAPIS